MLKRIKVCKASTWETLNEYYYNVHYCKVFAAVSLHLS